MAKFIRCDPKKVAKSATFKWAVDKSLAITEALALSLGNLSPNTGGGHQQEKDNRENPSERNNNRPQHSSDRKPKVTFKDSNQDHYDRQYDRDRPDDRLAMAFDNLAATIVNTRESKEHSRTIPGRTKQSV
jgi:hypothetical protein